MAKPSVYTPSGKEEGHTQAIIIEDKQAIPTEISKVGD
jgi:hypothetical protein